MAATTETIGGWTVAMATQTQTIRCKEPTCEQVIAVKHPSGDVRPVVVGAFVDNRGRLTIICPSCGHRNRVDTTRRA